MFKEEFEKILSERIGRTCTVTMEDYKIIEYVYNWHPALDYYPALAYCDEAKGAKGRMAELYMVGGMGLISSMVPEAKKAEEISDECRLLRCQIEEFRQKIQECQNRLNAIYAIKKEDHDRWSM